MEAIAADRVYVVVPVFNENADVLCETLVQLLAFFPQVVVVDDGSAVPLQVTLQDLPVYLLRHPANLGQGASLQTGTDFALARGAEAIIHFDADGQHTPADAARMLQFLREDRADVVLGSRFLNKEGAGPMPKGRRAVLQVGRVVNFVFTGLWLTDAHQGLRALNRKAAWSIRLQENRQAHATEVLLQIRTHRLRYVEMPVKTIYTEYSLAKGQRSAGAFSIFVDLILNKLFR